MKQIVCILTIIIIIIVGTERCESSVSWHIRRGRCLLCWPAVAVTWHICLAYQDIIEQCCKRKHTCATYSGVFRIWQKRGPGAEPLVGGSEGRSPLEAETLFASECSMETANSSIFLKFGNVKDHQTLLNFAILAGKWQKMHVFI